MTLIELINEYKRMAHICSQIDYLDKNSVKNNNKAVKRMYEIVNIIKSEFGEIGIIEFAKLIDYEEYQTNVWASVQMLEKMPIAFVTEQRALKIIKQEARHSVGMEYWLKAYQQRKNNI